MVLRHSPSLAILHGLRISLPVDLRDLGFSIITFRQKLKTCRCNQFIYNFELALGK